MQIALYAGIYISEWLTVSRWSVMEGQMDTELPQHIPRDATQAQYKPAELMYRYRNESRQQHA